MVNLSNNPDSDYVHSVQVVTVCIVALFIKMWHSAVRASSHRIKAGKTFNPEDATVFSNATRQVVPTTAEEFKNADYERWSRIQQNDWENIPMFCAIAIISIAALGKPIAISVLTAVFTGARFAHTICFAYAIQPWRSIVFLIALASQFALAGVAIAGAFS